MRPVGVVTLLSDLDDAFGVAQGVKLVDAEILLSKPAVEGCDENVSPRLPRRNKHSFHLDNPLQGLSRLIRVNQHWPFVH
jgi:hypothetical protein